MTQIAPNFPIPTDAVAGDWAGFNGHPDDWIRTLTWAQFGAAGGLVAVRGAQYADGHVDRFVYLDDVAEELTAITARQLAAALLNAADSLESAL